MRHRCLPSIASTNRIFFAGLVARDCLAEVNEHGERLRVVCIRAQLSDLKESAKLSSRMSGLTLPNLQAL